MLTFSNNYIRNKNLQNNTPKINKEKYKFKFKLKQCGRVLIFIRYKGNDLSVRVFVDYYGIPEDPATGSGNGCLAAYLVNHEYFGKTEVDIRVEQGYEVGRPSLLLLRAEQDKGQIRVSVGGKAFIVAKGELV